MALAITTASLFTGNLHASAQEAAPNSGRGEQGAALPEAVPRGAITFSELPAGTAVRDQYRYKGIRFSGDNPIVKVDGSNPTSPVLAGGSNFHGDIRGRFVERGTSTVRTVDSFSLDVGYINNPGQVRVQVFGRSGNLLGTITPSRRGIVRVQSPYRGAASFMVKIGSSEEAGVGIDNVVYPGQTVSTGNLLTNPGFELGFSPWRPIANAGTVNFTTYDHSTYPQGAKQGLRFAEFNVVQANSSIGQDVNYNIRAGDIITFKVWLRRPTCGTYSGTVAIWRLGAAVNQSATNFSIPGCSGWHRVTVQATVTQSDPTIRAEIYGNTVGGVNLDVDGASLSVNRVL